MKLPHDKTSQLVVLQFAM